MRDNIGVMIPMIRVTSPSPIRKRCRSIAVEPLPKSGSALAEIKGPAYAGCAPQQWALERADR
jgi:hypothetical protein